MKSMFRISAILFLVGFSLALSYTAFAQSSKTAELQSQITERQQEIAKLEKEIAEDQKALEALGGEKKTLQGEINQIDLLRKRLTKDISLTQQKIHIASLEIDDLAIEINDKELRIKKNREGIAAILRVLHEMNDTTLLEMVLSENQFNEEFLNLDFLVQVEDAISGRLAELRNLRGELTIQKEKAVRGKKKLDALNEDIRDQKLLVDGKRREQSVLLVETKNKESTYQKLLAEKQSRIKQFQRDIEEFENALRIELDPTNLPSPGSKSLSWPLENVFITQKFGSTQSAQRLYTSGTHNGIDLRAPVGSHVLAAADGVVVGAGDTDRTCRGASYGKWILIRHGNGLSTLYAHLDVIRVSEGQNVSRLQTIGLSGNTGYSTGPHLHFTVFASPAVRVSELPSSSCKNALYTIPVSPRNGYLDPELYL